MSASMIVIAGGSGFIGRSLQRHFTLLGYGVVLLTRGRESRGDGVSYVHWDGRTPGAWCDALDGAQALVNLTGRSVDCRYHAANRREIVASRVDSVAALAAGIARCVSPPRVWVQASTTAIYGEAGDAVLDETAAPNVGFSPEVAKAWEKAFNDAYVPGVRKVLLRISFVLGRDGGALRKLALLTRLGLGGAVGTGRQWVSWIHHRDLDRMVAWAVRDERVSGLYHATSPSPVTNDAFMRELRRALHRPWSPRTPAWAVEIGSVLMRTESELALKGRRCVPAKAVREGFAFEHPELAAALAEVFAPVENDERAVVAPLAASHSGARP